MKLWRVAFATTLSLLPALPAGAEQIRLLSAGAMRHTVEKIAEDFRKQTGHEIVLTTGTAGEMVQRLAAGEVADMVIAPPATLEAMARDGKVDLASRTDLGRVRVGLGMRKGDTAPDISTLAAFKSALLAARKIVYSHPSSGASSGIHFARVVKEQGLEAELASRTVFRQGGTAVMDAVAKGEGDLGITQISEILPVAGVYLVGPIPAEIQQITTYSAAVASGARSADLVKRWIAFLTRDESRALYRQAGFESP